MPRSTSNSHAQRAIAVVLTLFGLALCAAGLTLSDGAPLHGVGPAQKYGIPVGLVCFALLAVVATRYRKWQGTHGRSEPQSKTNRLYLATSAILFVGLFLIPAAVIAVGRTGSGKSAPPTGLPTPPPPPTATPTTIVIPPTSTGRPVNAMPLLIAIGVVMLIVIGLLIWRWLRTLNLRLSVDLITGVEPSPVQDDQDQQVLAEAMSAGRRALEGDDARAAIIACYAAMEESLAEAGVARGRAESPAELLGRATSGGLLRGAGPYTLAGLFREARFSTHPMGTEQMHAARAALDECTAQLRAVPAEAL
jgi:hypothetical protein